MLIPLFLIVACEGAAESPEPAAPSVRAPEPGMAALARPIGAGGQPTSRHVWPEPLAQRVQDAELPQRRALIVRFEAWARRPVRAG